MPSISRLTGATLALLVPFGSLLAQGGPTPKLPPVRALKPVERTASESFTAVSTARALPGGRVIVNDVAGRRLLLFDSTLSNPVVIADTTSATANAYASRMAGLLAWRGDSSLFVDPQSLSMLVLDGQGKVARVMSVPRPDDAMSLIGGPNGTPGLDAQGRLVYRAQMNFRAFGQVRGAVAAGGAGGRANPQPQIPAFPDSLPLVRLTLATRKLDTVAYVRVQKVNMSMTRDDNGRVSMTSTINPMQVVDDWAILPDGRIAIVRGRDYHVDWVDGDGKVESQPKLPFAWRHMDDSMKVAFIDSTKAAMEKVRERQMAAMKAGGNPAAVVPEGPGGGGGGAPMIVMRMDGGGPPPGGPGGGGDGPRPSGATQNISMPPLNFVEPSALPDYAPPFSAGATRADAEGNLWIRTSVVINGGSVYDVVSPKGELIDRVQVPAGRVIAGFGAGGVVYMGVRKDGVAKLEQARR